MSVTVVGMYGMCCMSMYRSVFVCVMKEYGWNNNVKFIIIYPVGDPQYCRN